MSTGSLVARVTCWGGGREGASQSGGVGAGGLIWLHGQGAQTREVGAGGLIWGGDEAPAGAERGDAAEQDGSVRVRRDGFGRGAGAGFDAGLRRGMP